jgi:DNA-directed RNA polymerase specialized sigma24 family protein
MGRVSGKDSDFSDYVDARWNNLFRTAYVLRPDRRGAEDLTRAALAQAYVGWSQIRESDDPDAHVRRALLSAHAPWRTRRSWAAEASALKAAPGAAIDATVPMAASESVLEALMTLTPAQRTVVLLGWGNDLGPQQIAELTGLSSGAVLKLANEGTRTLREALALLESGRTGSRCARTSAPRSRAAVAEVRVPPQRTDEVMSAGRSRRSQRRVTVLASVVATCLVAAGVAWVWDSSQSEPDPDQRRQAASWDELEVPWIKGRRLVYADTSIARPPDLVALAATADSALMTVGDGQIRIIEVLPDGTQTVIGENVVGIALGIRPDTWRPGRRRSTRAAPRSLPTTRPSGR